MKHTLLFILTALFVGIVPIQVAEQDESVLAALAHEFDAWQTEGIERWIEDSTLKAIERRHVELVRIQESLLTIDRTALSNDELILYAVFEHLLAEEIGKYEFGHHLIPFGPFWGPDRWLQGYGLGRAEMSIEMLEEYGTVIRKYSSYLRNIRHRMKKGLADGVTPPRITIRDLPDRLEALLEPHALENLSEPFSQISDDARTKQYVTLWVEYSRRGLPAIMRELKSLHTFIRDEYEPGCRNSIAATALPRGAQYYKHTLRILAGTERSPRELHKLGLSEVQRLKAEAVQTIQKLGILSEDSDSRISDSDLYFRRAVEELTSNSQYRHSDSRELLRAARDISKQVDGWLPSFFVDLPRLPFAIIETPPGTHDNNAVGYLLGNLKDGVSSQVTFNTSDLSRHPTWIMTPFVLHEGMPGHHLQFGLGHEIPMNYRFQQNAWFAGFGEGWAMYAEWLGKDMYLYRDPVNEFGRIASELHRACRLVVDPAIHTLGWSREQAIKYMQDNTALPYPSILVEIDRMIAYPGQACSYTVNGLRIRELRDKAEIILGRQFDVREFHNAILSAGTVPMSVVERRVNKWINDTRSTPQNSEEPKIPIPE